MKRLVQSRKVITSCLFESLNIKGSAKNRVSGNASVAYYIGIGIHKIAIASSPLFLRRCAGDTGYNNSDWFPVNYNLYEM